MILQPDGTPPGVPGSSPEIREVDPDEFGRIEGRLRGGLGPPDQIMDFPNKGRVEIWEVSPDGRVLYRDFSRSGRLGVSAPPTIEVHGEVPGLEGVRKIHAR